MKKKISIFLAGLMTASTVQVNTFADDKNNQKSSAFIESNINFTKNETKDYIINHNLKVILKDDKNIVKEIPIADILNNKEPKDVVSNVEEEQGVIKNINLKLTNISPAKKYTLSLSGDKYKKVDIPIKLDNYSKKVNLDTSNVFVYGDLDKNNKIDENDRALIEKSIENKDNKADLNNDNIVDIEDISYINRKIGNSPNVTVYDTEAIKEVIAEQVKKEIPQNANFSLEGGKDLSSLLKEEVKIEPKDNKKDVSVPITFNEVQEMSTFSLIVGPETDINDVSISFKNEKGEIIKVDNKSNALFSENDAELDNNPLSRSSEKVITINIGNRVPVKEIIIDIKPNDTGYTIIKEVNYIKDVVDNTFIETTAVTNFKALAGEESVNLSWNPVSNVRGYRVYYGTDKANLNLSTDTVETKASISGLENDTTYYFMVKSISDIWEGDPSEIISATPKKASKPNKPDYLKAVARDSSVELSWKKAEGADTYNIYMQEGLTGEVKNIKTGVSATSYTVGGLKNDTVYRFYVTGVNVKGESEKSEPADATPVKETIIIPTLPTLDRIPSEEIISVTMGHKDNVNPNLYPNHSFKPEHLIDGDFNTHWVARTWSEANTFAFTFNTPKDMDYVIWVPRLDGRYRESFDRYNIYIWLEGDDLNGKGREVAIDRPISFRGEDNRYFVFDFPKQEKVKKIKIRPTQWNGSPTDISASEVAFYNYNNIGDQVSDLFTDGSRTKIKSTTTKEKIAELREKVNVAEGYVHSRDVLNRELNIAQSLIDNDNSNLGYIKNNFVSIDEEIDKNNYQISISSLQPLGIAAMAKDKIEIFAHIPEGGSLHLVPTQYFEQSDRFKGKPITLKEGRNTITIPKIGNEYYDRGGSLYLTYKGNKPEEVKVQVFGGHKVPYLELNDFYKLSPEQVKERIKTFVTDLQTYTPTLKGNKEHQALNISEISLPNILLSLPASQILAGIDQSTSTLEEKVNKVYDSILAWDDVIKVAYNTYGIDDHKNSLSTRHNIRYMKMFAGAFMYAAGDHIGVGFNSVPELIQGKPLSKLTNSDTKNNLFGWGIAHEIGHVMDKLGHAEITNNIYSLMLQTANKEGNNNSFTTRLESSNVYPKAFQKVAVGNKGASNDVFTQLAMYWQLNLAYGNNFYNEVYKIIRQGSVAGNNIDEKFALAASQVAKKDLSEFFTRWGMDLPENIINEMKKKEKENRAIWYLSDKSNRSSFKGNSNIDIDVSIDQTIDKNNDNVVTIKIMPNNESPENIQGYEISRNDKKIGFTTNGEFVDKIDSGNFAYTYKITPIDIKGNISKEYTSKEMKFVFDNVISSGVKTEKIVAGNKNYVKISFDENQVTSGIKLTPKESNSLDKTGNFKVYIKSMDSNETPQNSQVVPNDEVTENKDTLPNDTTPQNNEVAPSDESIQNVDTLSNDTNTLSTDTLISNDVAQNSDDLTDDTATNIDALVIDEATQNNDTLTIDTNTLSNDTNQSNENISSSENSSDNEDLTTNENVINNKNYILAKNADFSQNASDNKDANFIEYFNKPNAIQGELDKIWQYETKEIILEDVDLDKYNVEIISYTGDNVEFLDTAFGVLKTEKFGIPEGTKIVVGKYRGNTATNEIVIKGRFLNNNPINDEPSYEERLISGKILMLDEVPDNGKITSSTKEGIFIFIPNFESKEDLEHSHTSVSKLPVQIKAEMSKKSSTGDRVTSDTVWIDTPSFDTLPKIEFN